MSALFQALWAALQVFLHERALANTVEEIKAKRAQLNQNQRDEQHELIFIATNGKTLEERQRALAELRKLTSE